jgi:hypothetical protein
MSAIAYTGWAPRDATRRRRLLLFGIGTGLVLLVLPLSVYASVRYADPADPLVSRILAVETLLIVAAQVALAIFFVWKMPELGPVRALIPSTIAGFVVATGDVVALSTAFGAPIAGDVAPILAYDVVFGVAIAAPFVVVLRAYARYRKREENAEIDASPAALIEGYRRVLQESEESAKRWWSVRKRLADQLLRRHVRQTLDAIQRGYARRAAEPESDPSNARARQLIGDYLPAVPPMSSVVPIPTVASVFVLWKLVPMLVAAAGGGAAWVGGGEWALTDAVSAVAAFMPAEVASLILDGLALTIAFSLLMVVLAPAIRRRDELLKKHKICEIEVALMDHELHEPRSSRGREYVLTGLPALPFLLYGGAVLAYALAGLFVYPSPQGPLGGLVERADVMHLGPVTGVILSQAFLLGAAIWIAWIVDARLRTRTPAGKPPRKRCLPAAA